MTRRLTRQLGSLGTMLCLGVWVSPCPAQGRAQPEGVGQGEPAGISVSVRTETSCIGCHGDEALFGSEGVQLIQNFREDVHASLGLSCHDCHGGNPDPSLVEDMDAAMNEKFKPSPYLGAPDPGEVPAFCGRCHSSLEYMRRYNPNARIDQEREYWTSQHGQALKSGDTKVATCSSCHGVHGILATENPRSRVYPRQVAETCRECHADTGRMAGYQVLPGVPLPVDQYARWRQSVHAKALVEREDLSAPTCNDCHGNHGAQPPGVQSIAFVCGECHGREADVFRGSPKYTGFDEHNELLADAGAEGCAACHAEPEPAAALGPIHSLNECAACHDNHAVVRPTVALLSPLPDTPCAFCHEGPDSLPVEAPDPRGQVERYQSALNDLLERSGELGLEGEGRFDWMVDQAMSLEYHTWTAAAEGAEGGARLRPEFDRLVTKFRIGKTTFTYTDPVTGQPIEASLRRCKDCHASGSKGLQVAQDLLNHMSGLTSKAARADRILLAAQRGGVLTRDAAEHVDRTIDIQIELEVLLHSFDTSSTGVFAAKHKEGLEHANAALEAGRRALDDLAFRRRGLAISLVFILLLLIALGLKIRQISEKRVDETPRTRVSP